MRTVIARPQGRTLLSKGRVVQSSGIASCTQRNINRKASNYAHEGTYSDDFHKKTINLTSSIQPLRIGLGRPAMQGFRPPKIAMLVPRLGIGYDG